MFERLKNWWSRRKKRSDPAEKPYRVFVDLGGGYGTIVADEDEARAYVMQRVIATGKVVSASWFGITKEQVEELEKQHGGTK